MSNNLSIESKKVYFFCLVLFIVILIQFTFVRNYDSYSDFYQGMMTEAFGFIADILLFGIVITIYEIGWKKKETIIRYIEELEDYRGWNEKEASYRVFGLMKRLHKLNKIDIDLSNCYFEEVPFSKNFFDGFDFKESLIYGTKFKKCNLQLSIFNNIQQKHIQDFYDYCTIFEETIFQNCNLRDSKFMNNERFVDLHFLECDMENADLSNSHFLRCLFKDIDFLNIKLNNTKFEDCTFIYCKNIELIGNNINPKITKVIRSLNDIQHSINEVESL
jgi:uncharacterized protein YjbI with pentapeptide repeats